MSNPDKKTANFRDANLKGVTFKDTDLSNADFTNADLEGAKFIGCLIVAANFSNCNLEGADFTDCITSLEEINTCTLSESCGDEGSTTAAPQGINFPVKIETAPGREPEAAVEPKLPTYPDDLTVSDGIIAFMLSSWFNPPRIIIETGGIGRGGLYVKDPVGLRRFARDLTGSPMLCVEPYTLECCTGDKTFVRAEAVGGPILYGKSGTIKGSVALTDTERSAVVAWLNAAADAMDGGTKSSPSQVESKSEMEATPKQPVFPADFPFGDFFFFFTSADSGYVCVYRRSGNRVVASCDLPSLTRFARSLTDRSTLGVWRVNCKSGDGSSFAHTYDPGDYIVVIEKGNHREPVEVNGATLQALQVWMDAAIAKITALQPTTEPTPAPELALTAKITPEKYISPCKGWHARRTHSGVDLGKIGTGSWTVISSNKANIIEFARCLKLNMPHVTYTLNCSTRASDRIESQGDRLALIDRHGRRGFTLTASQRAEFADWLLAAVTPPGESVKPEEKPAAVVTDERYTSPDGKWNASVIAGCLRFFAKSGTCILEIANPAEIEGLAVQVATPRRRLL